MKIKRLKMPSKVVDSLMSELKQSRGIDYKLALELARISDNQGVVETNSKLVIKLTKVFKCDERTIKRGFSSLIDKGVIISLKGKGLVNTLERDIGFYQVNPIFTKNKGWSVYRRLADDKTYKIYFKEDLNPNSIERCFALMDGKEHRLTEHEMAMNTIKDGQQLINGVIIEAKYTIDDELLNDENHLFDGINIIGNFKEWDYLYHDNSFNELDDDILDQITEYMEANKSRFEEIFSIK